MANSFLYKDYMIIPRDHLWEIWTPDDSFIATTLTKAGAKAFVRKHIKRQSK